MIRSGSTRSFNICRLLLERAGKLDRTVAGYVGEGEAADRVLEQLDAESQDVLLKMHNPGPYAEQMIREGRAKDVYTHRDPRDAIVSAHRIWNWSIEDAIGSLATIMPVFERRWQSNNTLFIAYSDIVAHSDVVVRRIADYLGIHVDTATEASISAATSMEAARKAASDPATPVHHKFDSHYDPVTLLHKGHIRDGRSGYWRQHLSEDQAARVVELAGPLFERLGYVR